VFAAYGRGARPYGVRTIEDLRPNRSWIAFAGFDVAVFSHVRLQLNYTHQDEGGPRRNQLYLGTGYRW
jgi:hypothetical protein